MRFVPTFDGYRELVFAKLIAQFIRSLAQVCLYLRGPGVAEFFAIVAGGLAGLQNLSRSKALLESRLTDWLFYAAGMHSVLLIFVDVFHLIHTVDKEWPPGIIARIYQLFSEPATVHFLVDLLVCFDFQKAISDKFDNTHGTRVNELKRMDISPGYTSWFFDAIRLSELPLVKLIKRLLNR